MIDMSSGNQAREVAVSGSSLALPYSGPEGAERFTTYVILNTPE